MEPKTVNDYLIKLLELPDQNNDPGSEFQTLLSVLDRIRKDVGGNRLLRLHVSSDFYKRFRGILKPFETPDPIPYCFSKKSESVMVES